MSRGEWEKYSDTDTTRKSIVQVDDKLGQYHRQVNPKDKLKLLEELRTLLTQYIQMRNKSRKPMVYRLLLDTKKEDEMLRSALAAEVMRKACCLPFSYQLNI